MKLTRRQQASIDAVFALTTENNWLEINLTTNAVFAQANFAGWAQAAARSPEKAQEFRALSAEFRRAEAFGHSVWVAKQLPVAA